MSIQEVRTQNTQAAEIIRPASSPAPSPTPQQTSDQLQPHPQAGKSTSCIASCMQRVWAYITDFFRWVFCRSETQKTSLPTRVETSNTSSRVEPAQTQKTKTQMSELVAPQTKQTQKEGAPVVKPKETLVPEVAAPTSAPDFSKPMGFEKLAQLENKELLFKVEDFFGRYADQDNRLQHGRIFFDHTCPEHIQKWILFALVTKKNLVSCGKPEQQNTVAQFLKNSSDGDNDMEIIERYINISKSSVYALMKEFEREEISPLTQTPCKLVHIKKENLPRIAAILEENLRSTIAKDYGRPASSKPIEPAAKRPPLSTRGNNMVESFMEVFRGNYTNAAAIKLFQEYTANKWPESERVQEMILEQLVDKKEFKAMRTLLLELTTNRHDAFYEKLWISPSDNLKDVDPSRIKSVLQEGLSTPITMKT